MISHSYSPTPPHTPKNKKIKPSSFLWDSHAHRKMICHSDRNKPSSWKSTTLVWENQTLEDSGDIPRLAVEVGPGAAAACLSLLTSVPPAGQQTRTASSCHWSKERQPGPVTHTRRHMQVRCCSCSAANLSFCIALPQADLRFQTSKRMTPRTQSEPHPAHFSCACFLLPSPFFFFFF